MFCLRKQRSIHYFLKLFLSPSLKVFKIIILSYVNLNNDSSLNWYLSKQPTYKAAAAAANLLQSCPTLCDLIDSSPSGSSVHEILQTRILEWVAISFSYRARVYIPQEGKQCNSFLEVTEDSLALRGVDCSKAAWVHHLCGLSQMAIVVLIHLSE